MRSFLPLVLVTVALSGCGIRDTSAVESGTYVAVDASLGDGITDEPLLDVVLEVDRDGGTATLTDTEDGTVAFDLVELDRDLWPTDCPTNFSSVRVELVLLDVDSVMLSDTTFNDPALIAGCGMDGAEPHVTLTHASDETNGARASCGMLPCLGFEPE
jgi:hypothetical protein